MKVKRKVNNTCVSDDNLFESASKNAVEMYEQRQLKRIFDKRTFVTTLGPATILYQFAEGDLKTFEEFHKLTVIDAKNTSGYFVFVEDSSYDNIGDNYYLYDIDTYNDMVKDMIKKYQNILENISDKIMMINTLGSKKG